MTQNSSPIHLDATNVSDMVQVLNNRIQCCTVEDALNESLTITQVQKQRYVWKILNQAIQSQSRMAK